MRSKDAPRHTLQIAYGLQGKKRCRMHGGAEGSGAPKGNQNALKHGRYTKEEIQSRKALREFIQQALKTAREVG